MSVWVVVAVFVAGLATGLVLCLVVIASLAACGTFSAVRDEALRQSAMVSRPPGHNAVGPSSYTRSRNSTNNPWRES